MISIRVLASKLSLAPPSVSWYPFRTLFRPPLNVPYRGIYRTDGEQCMKDELLVCQYKMNYHPGLNVSNKFVYVRQDRGSYLLKSHVDGHVMITQEEIHPDLSLPENAPYLSRRCNKGNFFSVIAILISLDIQRVIELIEHVQKTGELSNAKLATLQKVLQSDFFNSVREIFEHVYDAINADSPRDVRANAASKATVAAFAAAEGHSHPRIVELPKTDQGLGFNVMGGKEQNSPIYISRIIPGGVADRNGQLRRGDQLIAVNGVNVECECHEKAVELLKSATGTVKLVVRYMPKLLDEMERRFERQRRRINQNSPAPIFRR
ncbi:unnamed protein product [Enterobius vermicularis]|uniref:Protein lin-7 homolog B n=1 Tax=Enterobius vermicularis TaxID=51028 RepID=A0A0N4VF18_ENTVE|nr:unnamed protein product [Enterobius vermicularis]